MPPLAISTMASAYHPPSPPARRHHLSRQSSARSTLDFSTAYNGSEGHIDDLGNNSYEDIDLPAAPKPTTARPALGSRLLSTLANAQPAAAALSRKSSVLHSRARSLAGFVPKFSPASPSSPESGQNKERPGSQFFADLFSGESAPIRLAPPVSPTKEEQEEAVMDYRPAFTERPVGARQRSIAQTPSPSSKSPGVLGGASAWFTRNKALPGPRTAPSTPDELLHLGIQTSLFPHGPADPLSPHAFNDLLLNATSLLERYQSAYREKCTYISSIHPEIEAQREEVEESETRVAHLKLQLEDMGRKASEQERAMREMAEEIVRVKAEARRAASVRIVSTEDAADERQGGGEEGEGEEEDEDEGVEGRSRAPGRRKRVSDELRSERGSDSGFESDAESGVVSPVPSVGMSPRYDGHPSVGMSPRYDGQGWENARPSFSRMSTASGLSSNVGGGEEWPVVERLRRENQRLRVQVEGMQRELQGVIDFVGVGIGV